MGKIYLQEKIEPKPDKYIIVGQDGFLTTGDVPVEACPEIIITTDPGRDVTEFSAYCNNQKRNPEFIKINDHTFACSLDEFGSWRIVINEDIEPDPENPDADVLSEYIEITEIRIYYMTLTIGNSSSGGGGSAELNAYTWAQIKEIVNQGTAGSLFHIGDAKKVVLNGTCGTTTFNDFETYAYIIGIDHNSNIEGQGLTFQLGYINNTNTNTIAFVDEYKNTLQKTDNYCFHINRGYYLFGYNEKCSMPWYYTADDQCDAYSLLNTDTSSFLSCLPEELVSSMSSKPIFTDNGFAGRRDRYTEFSASNISLSKSKLFLLSEYEIFGQIINSSPYEEPYQAQYAFYQNTNNSKIKYEYNNSTTPVKYWTRSRVYTPNGNFCCVDTTGNSSTINSLYSLGLAPAFAISNDIFTGTNLFINNSGSTTTSSYYASAYLRIHKSDNTVETITNIGSYEINSNVTKIEIVGKSGRDTWTDTDGTTYTIKVIVKVKLNGTEVGNATGTSAAHSDFTTYQTLYNITDLLNKGAIQISLRKIDCGSLYYSSGTYTTYVNIIM